MPCYHPLGAFRLPGGQVVFGGGKAQSGEPFLLPCGRCVGCRLERARQWAVRCMHEASLWPSNWFLTLTYSDEYLPPGGSLRYRDFQLFMKRLRKAHKDVRFFMCGEYGESMGRPHYHCVLFNCDFPDKRYFAKSGENRLYESDELTRIWGLGHVNFGAVTFESAGYVARYSLKKVTGALAELHYSIVDPLTGEVFVREPEFGKMSLKPGIGAAWWDKFGDQVAMHDRVIVNGVPAKPPRYYDKRLKASVRDVHFEELKADRAYKAYQKRDDNTERRLADKEAVVLGQLRLKPRSNV